MRVLPLCCFLLASTLQAQGTFRLDRQTPGVLGGPLIFSYQGANPGGIFRLMDFLPGPTGPIPGITNIALGVGPSPAVLFEFTPTGTGQFSPFNLPNIAVYAGVDLHVQAVTLDLSGPPAPLLAQVSFETVAQTGVLNTPVQLTGPRQPGRSSSPGIGRAVALLIRDNDPADQPTWLYAGGLFRPAGGANVAPVDSERFDPRTLTFTMGPSLSQSRAGGLAVELLDGRTLVIGGTNAPGIATQTCEIYDPATNAFVPTGSMAQARTLMAAGRLGSGHVVVVGGTGNVSGFLVAANTANGLCEVFDPATGSWSPGPTPYAGFPLFGAKITELTNGSLLLSGGWEYQSTVIFPPAINATLRNSCRILSSPTGPWVPTGSMATARTLHETVVLPDGRVLALGGARVDVTNPFNPTALTIADVERFDPVAGTWSTLASAPVSFAASQPIYQPVTNSVVVVGGASGNIPSFGLGGTGGAPPSDNVSRLDLNAATPTWSLMPNLQAPRGAHATVLTFPDLLTVVFCGFTVGGGPTPLATAETIRF